MAPSFLTPGGIVIPVAERIKKELNIPVIVAGKIDPDLAEKTVAEGKTDFVALGRPLLADPDLPVKLRDGKEEEVFRCLYCNNCLKSSWRSCTVNPFLYRESSAHVVLSASPKKIMVIGGGPAGMEAAVLCKLSGHEVSLFEKESELGGQWKAACGLPWKQGYASFIDVLKRSLERLKVPVTLNKEITKEDVEILKPQVAIVATGALPAGLDLPGCDRSNIVTANEIIQRKGEAAGNIAVIGGSMTAVEIAVWLAEQGRAVALVSRGGLGGRKGPDDPITFRGLLRRLVQLRVPLYLNADIIELIDNSVVIGWGGEIFPVPADTVVSAVGVQPVDKLVGELKGTVPEVYPIGDCMLPGNAAQATFSAARLVAKL
jgi:pyruvate/2-oxoglutarate dehydrogenase complex dihydrolipoamide dehydrogenase (E3) component